MTTAPAPSTFDVNAAWLRKAAGDLKAFMGAFAARIEGALPSRVAVERKRDGFFSGTTHVAKVAVAFEHGTYSLTLEKGHLVALRAKVVRGVTLKSETMAVPAWLAALNDEIGALAAEAGAAHTVIHDFLMS